MPSNHENKITFWRDLSDFCVNLGKMQVIYDLDLVSVDCWMKQIMLLQKMRKCSPEYFQSMVLKIQTFETLKYVWLCDFVCWVWADLCDPPHLQSFPQLPGFINSVIVRNLPRIYVHISVMQCLHASLVHSSRPTVWIQRTPDQSERGWRSSANERPPSGHVTSGQPIRGEHRDSSTNERRVLRWWQGRAPGWGHVMKHEAGCKGGTGWF